MLPKTPAAGRLPGEAASVPPPGGAPEGTATVAPPGSGRPVRDPWQEDDAADAEPGEHTHDPHEVTVQLDSVQFTDGVLRRTPGGRGGVAEPSDGPVFVDESGRRGRRYRRIGLTVGLACAGYAVVIVATLLSGNSDAPWLPVPGQQQDTPAGKVETSPDAAESDGVPGSGASLGPGGLPDAGDLTLPTPGASLPAPGATARQDAGGARTTAPVPGSSGRATKPAPDGAADPTPSAPPATTVAPPPASTPAEEPPPVTTDPAGGGGDDGADTDDVADAPAGPPVVAAESPDAPQAPSDPSAAPSPEHVL
ncbi:hypothetical protein [Streptomyces sp. enrichment culture]|uniref:hypothetical protein n=1 Tax=Streptomyces sp. enrichment culture TaxID=1795815 RepID=UPI003F565B8B